MFKLSAFHRYGIAILAIIIIVVLFWPTGDKSTDSRPAQPIVVPPPTMPEIAPPTTTEEPTSDGTIEVPQTGVPAESEIIQEPPTEVELSKKPAEIETPVATIPPKQTPPSTHPSANEWQNYQIKKGKTLAQLFRDNNLQANDAFVMARVEGVEKPLSNLHQGQKIRLKANAKGEVQLLELTTLEGNTFSFARLSDGSYYRTP